MTCVESTSVMGAVWVLMVSIESAMAMDYCCNSARFSINEAGRSGT